jgi:catechol 2,3-dioxygenase-like lactoylglutathione lyase family enzyme
MLQGIDHAVILVRNLDEAVESYTRLGFTVVPGGRHNFATHNALIGFEDGAYIELIAFWEDAPSHRWHRFLASGGGLIDYCMRTDDLVLDIAALRAAGIPMSEKQPMSRLRPDGYRLEWALSLATETQGVTPFLIEDYTPREERLPRQTRHPNGATGIAMLTIGVRDLTPVLKLAAADGVRRLPTEGDSRTRSLRYVSGGYALDFVAPAPGQAGGRDGVFALALATTGPAIAIDPEQAHNARLSLVPP